MGKQKKIPSATYQVRVSDNAQKNFDEITGYIAFIKQEPANAIEVGDKILETFDRIALNPLAFRQCDELKTKAKIYRRAICLSWQVVYKICPLEIVILGIIHKSRKPSAVKILRKIE